VSHVTQYMQHAVEQRKLQAMLKNLLGRNLKGVQLPCTMTTPPTRISVMSHCCKCSSQWQSRAPQETIKLSAESPLVSSLHEKTPSRPKSISASRQRKPQAKISHCDMVRRWLQLLCCAL
jgi:hypothetical protein